MFAELDLRFENGFDPEVSISADVDELTEPALLLLIVRLREERSYSPVLPSTDSRSRSAWPLCRAYSSIM